jgi:vacuolar iron transporter family protein
MRAARFSSSDPPREMATSRAVPARSPALGRLAGHYLPDLVYGANDGIITTFAVVSGVVGAALSERVIVILGFANLVADGFSMGASNYLARRSQFEDDLADRRDALRHGAATVVGFLVAGVVPLLAYLVPLEQGLRLPLAIGLAGAALFAVGGARTFVTKRGLLLSGLEMLLVGSLAAVVAFGIGALAASFA